MADNSIRGLLQKLWHLFLSPNDNCEYELQRKDFGSSHGFKISNEEQKIRNENAQEELDMEKDHQALQNLFDANNNDRMIR